MGGRSGPPDGDERPLRGLPGGRARPRPSPPRPTPPDDGQAGEPTPGDGDRPGDRPARRPPGDGGRSGQGGNGGVVRPLRPLRVVPGGTAPPLRVIPGGAGAPTELDHGDGQVPDAERGDGDGRVDGVRTISPPLPVAEPAGARRRSRPRRRRLAVVVALLLVAGLAVTGRLAAERPRTGVSPAPATTASPGSVAPVQPSPIVATVPTGGFSSAMAAGAGALWVVGSDEVIRIDPATDKVAARIPVRATGSGPAAVAVGAGAVWVPVAVPGALLGIDPGNDKVAARISLGGPLRGPMSVAATRDTVWVACCGDTEAGAPTPGGRLLRVDPVRKRVVADIALPAAPMAVAADSSAAWVATADGQVLMVSQKRNRIAATIDAGGPLGFSQTIAVGAGGVWLADPFDEQIVRIDPKTRRVMARIPAGAVTGLAVTGEAVWALSPLGLVRVDPAQDRVAAIASDPDLRRARLVAADDAAVWASGWSSVSRIDPELVSP
jgi:DNA-binding beta-propeller fold protein YncE